MAQVEDRAPAIGRIFARAFAVVGAHSIAVFGLAFLFAACPQAAVTLAMSRLSTDNDTGMWFFGAFWLGLVVSLLAGVLTQGALVRVVVDHADGARASVGAATWTALRALLPLLVMGALAGIAMAIGFMLLVVPGILMWVMWSVSAPALVAERRGVFSAFGRSQDLTRGARWRVFALQMTLLVLSWLFAAAVGMVGILLTNMLGASTLLSATGVALSKMLSAGVSATIQCALYVELRDWKDGPATRHLADVFA